MGKQVLLIKGSPRKNGNTPVMAGLSWQRGK